jgi:hypothetical protein
MLLFLS